MVELLGADPRETGGGIAMAESPGDVYFSAML